MQELKNNGNKQVNTTNNKKNLRKDNECSRQASKHVRRIKTQHPILEYIHLIGSRNRRRNRRKKRDCRKKL